jgi:hypothetical protein
MTPLAGSTANTYAVACARLRAAFFASGTAVSPSRPLKIRAQTIGAIEAWVNCPLGLSHVNNQLSKRSVGPIASMLACTGAPDGSTRMAAGEGFADDVLSCQLKAMDRSSYAAVTFTDPQWARLQAAFPAGVCDYSKPGIGQQSTVAWQRYVRPDGTAVPGGEALPAAPPGTTVASAREAFDRGRGVAAACALAVSRPSTMAQAQKGASDDRLARFLLSSRGLSQLPADDQKEVMGCAREVRVPEGGSSFAAATLPSTGSV